MHNDAEKPNFHFKHKHTMHIHQSLINKQTNISLCVASTIF